MVKNDLFKRKLENVQPVLSLIDVSYKKQELFK